MRSPILGLRTLTLPYGATTGQPRIVIGPDIPAVLQAAYTSAGMPIVGCELFYLSNSDYIYQALIDNPAFTPNGGLAIGRVTAGTVFEYSFYSSDGNFALSADLVFDNGYNQVEETWHLMNLVNGWTNRGGGFVRAQYRRVPSPAGSVQLTGCILAGTKVNGTVVANLPVGYRPAARHGFPCQDTANPAALEFATNGDLMVFDLGAGANIQFNVIIPLDAT
jgi:hypothetical protein